MGNLVDKKIIAATFTTSC